MLFIRKRAAPWVAGWIQVETAEWMGYAGADDAVVMQCNRQRHEGRRTNYWLLHMSVDALMMAVVGPGRLMACQRVCVCASAWHTGARSSMEIMSAKLPKAPNGNEKKNYLYVCVMRAARTKEIEKKRRKSVSNRQTQIGVGRCWSPLDHFDGAARFTGILLIRRSDFHFRHCLVDGDGASGATWLLLPLRQSPHAAWFNWWQMKSIGALACQVNEETIIYYNIAVHGYSRIYPFGIHKSNAKYANELKPRSNNTAHTRKKKI